MGAFFSRRKWSDEQGARISFSTRAANQVEAAGARAAQRRMPHRLNW
jgi:hypothetical protein